jgi:uncharacterized protein involved in exopolysaccharide biosynthesis
VSLQDILAILRRRLWVVVLLVAVSLGVAYYISKRTPRVWRADAQMILVQRAASVVTVTQSGGGGSGERLVENVDTQVALVKNLGMAWRTINWLKNEGVAGRLPRSAVAGLTPQDLQKQISAAPVPDTDIFEISVDAEDKEKGAPARGRRLQGVHPVEKRAGDKKRPRDPRHADQPRGGGA